MDRLLIIGGGDVAWRALPWLRQRFRVFVLVRQAPDAARWRMGGAVPLRGDLDQPKTLQRLRGLANALLWTAPPEDSGPGDRRIRCAFAQLAQGLALPQRIVYISTSGVYGDCAGAVVTETRPPAPLSPRGERRLGSETRLRRIAGRGGCALRILRAPGIYATDRLPLERLQRRDPVLLPAEDVFTNHIHADDLARAACLALFRGGALRIYNICDNTHLPMGDFYDALADIFGLPRPPRASRTECAQRLSPMSLSFMRESRRLDNTRIRRELRWEPRYADVRDGLRAAQHDSPRQG
jgi:nucleoside-diphosphate-sugar epimerase